MVLITFDDAVNWDNWELYLRLFPPDGSRRNPNGCPIGATFFVSHNFTDYCMVRKLHAREQVRRKTLQFQSVCVCVIP
jgi:hypothetical protein